MPDHEDSAQPHDQVGAEEARRKVALLVQAFHSGREKFLSAEYSEAQARIDFIDKFWTALGWDVNHERQTNPYEQEVKVERGVPISGRAAVGPIMRSSHPISATFVSLLRQSAQPQTLTTPTTISN
jgi:hypothetical protein